MTAMNERLRITDVVRVPLRELDVVGDGCMAVPTGPGLGVSIDPDAVA